MHYRSFSRKRNINTLVTVTYIFISLLCYRWLAPLLLLLDLYEKSASVSKIKAVLETHVVMLLLILPCSYKCLNFVILNPFFADITYVCPACQASILFAQVPETA